MNSFGKKLFNEKVTKICHFLSRVHRQKDVQPVRLAGG
jgi:hypothetical protein